jgi:hypothetical protein
MRYPRELALSSQMPGAYREAYPEHPLLLPCLTFNALSIDSGGW